MCGSIRSLRWLVLLLLVSLSSVAGVAQKHERKRMERAEISTLEQEWKQAQMSEDIPMMDHLLSDDFLGITASGQLVTKVQQLDRMRTRQFEIRRFDMADTKIKISGRLAVVTSLVRLDAISSGAPLVGYFRYTRVYQRAQGDDWKITNFEATRVPNGAGAYGPDPSFPQAGSVTPPAAVPSSPKASRAKFASLQPQS
ncbi:MAG: nuclear transport factor 2 family protein [Janthinobacterium lividum]